MGQVNSTTRLCCAVVFFHAAGHGGAAQSEEIPLKQHWDGSSAGDQGGREPGWSES